MLIGDIREGVPATVIYRYSDIYIHLSEAGMEMEGQESKIQHIEETTILTYFLYWQWQVKKKKLLGNKTMREGRNNSSNNFTTRGAKNHKKI